MEIKHKSFIEVIAGQWKGLKGTVIGIYEKTYTIKQNGYVGSYSHVNKEDVTKLSVTY